MTKFTEDAQKVQREYYLGKIHRETALAMMDELMRHHGVIREDEILVDIPDGFRESSVYENGCEFVGEFTVRRAGSPYMWKRSFVRNLPQIDRQTFPAPLIRRHIKFDYTSPALQKVAAAQSPLSEEQRKFFGAYEKQMTEQIVTGRRRISAQFFGIKFEMEGNQ